MKVRVVGAGPAGLMAADVLSAAGLSVTIWDHHASPGRKFLLAGRGGLNITHAEPLDRMLARYGAAADWLAPAIRAFPPDAVREFCHGLGQDTFIGTSGRVFPRCMKASPLLRAWLQRLGSRGVRMESGKPWQGFDETPTILALGGASWPETGSTAAWVPVFRREGIDVTPLVASNVRQPVSWSAHFASRYAGKPLKNIAISVAGKRVRGEAMISANGLEGGAIYALSSVLRDNPVAPLILDLKPDLTDSEVESRLQLPKSKDSRSNRLRKLFNLSSQQIALMHETGAVSPKSCIITRAGEGELRRAISTAGGVARGAFDDGFRLIKFPSTSVCGEMMDWDAPTGGYLLQACLSSAHWAAKSLLKRISS